MFSFFHRTPKIHLDCFINDSYVYNSVPIVNAHKTYPKWWLDLPLTVERTFDFSQIKNAEYSRGMTDIVQKNNNMKNCYGFLEFYKRGAVIESWSDFIFKVGAAGYKFFCSHNDAPQEHDLSQRGQGFKNYHHVKLPNPWLFGTKEEVKFLFVCASWDMENYDFIIPPGILNFNLVTVAHINMFLPKKSHQFNIPVGQPLVHLIPLSDKKLVIQNHLVSDLEYKTKHVTVGASFFGWRKKMELMLKNKEREKLKCPFS